MNIVLTSAEIKRIASSKTTVLTIEIPSSVSLDSIQRLAKRDEIFIALGISQMEVTDYLGEPRKGLLITTDSAGVVESATASEETGQMNIDEVEEAREDEDAKGQEDSTEDGNEEDADGMQGAERDSDEEKEQEEDDGDEETDEEPQMPEDDDLPF
ncbi:hypothetical protein [Paenibacillus oleatilyticus]|uniref:hypothetical protein n=1 Tax=Paenibacillus oleatilyticus TaxID=2594886 RepID=UPI001C1FD19C|nr:hypothetical protein [Paenibacillus oleatilyticus]MBU7319015.1 hypothetical protein [Paenibacillus oleatilyticus]